MGRLGDDRAVAPVLAALLLVAIAVTAAAVAYTVATRLTEDGQAPAEIGFVESRGRCLSLLRVASAEDAAWNDLRVVVEGAGTYGIRAAGHLADGRAWSGDALDRRRPVRDGDVLRIGVADDVETVRVRVVDVATDTVAYRDQVDVVPDGDDPTGSLALDDGQTVRSLSQVGGSASDGCSGPATTRVTVQRADGAYLSPSGFQAEPHVYEGSGSDWTADVDEDRLTEGDYTIRAIPVDGAGRAGPTRTVDVTYDPDAPVHDPGHAYEDVDNDGLYDPATDVAIPDSQVRDGRYLVDEQDHGLVLPPSLGAIDVDGRVQFRAGATGHLVVEVDLTGDGHVKLDAGTDLQAEDVTLASAGEMVKLRAGEGLDAAGLRVDAEKRVDLDARGDVNLTGADLASETEHVSVRASTGGFDVDVEDASLDSAKHLEVTASAAVDADGATLVAADNATLTGGRPSDVVHVDGARVDDDNDVAKAGPNRVAIEGEPAAGDVDHQG